MGILSYYLATSLDGYLARKDGSVDWLNPYQFKLNTPFDYEEYYKSVSTVIMGRKTWEVACSFETEPYSDRQTFLVSNSLSQGNLPSYCKLINKLDKQLVEKIKQESSNRVWLVGGANLASQLFEFGLIDEIVQTIVPVTIGNGISWQSPHLVSAQWKLVDSYKCDQSVVQLIYQKLNKV